MKRLSAGFFILAGSLLGLILWGPPGSYARDGGARGKVPEGVYLELTRDFYEALMDEGSGGTKVYSNDPSLEYLKQISISARFMVETNLEILRMQERIIQRLDALSKNRNK